MSDKIKILWVDDEIDMLRPQIKFLEQRGYELTAVSNGYDALDKFNEFNTYDAVFLDESMPGMSGLETLTKIKDISSATPIVMITKNEEEHIMEEAIGAQIADYLIKPVNPSQILLSLKKILDEKRLVREKTSSNYQQEFRQIFLELNDGPDVKSWPTLYRKIIGWEMKLDQANSSEMSEILIMQKGQANTEFCKFVVNNYESWVNGSDDAPVMSHNLMREKIFPNLEDDVPNVVILLDNLRFDQWKTIEPVVSDLYKVEQEDTFFAILPTSTQYSRNAIFSGMMPSEIEQKYPNLWKNDPEEGGKNLSEDFFLEEQVKRVFRKPMKVEYFKVTTMNHGKSLVDNALNFLNNNLTVVVYNFMDMLSHARTEMDVLKELASDEKAYRSLTKSWFSNSPLISFLEKIAEKKVKLFITTDHGSIRVHSPSKVIGDRDTTTNLRYKVGRNLNFEQNDVLDFKDPSKAKLPKPNISSSFIFAKEDKYFLYPNNFNYYMNYYKDTFQHGGISLEEMICPVIMLRSKNG